MFNTTIIGHKDLLPIDSNDIILFISIFFVIILSSTSGVGGGGILIPLFMLIGNFDILNAAALTVLVIACNSFIRMIFLINKKHPQSNKRYLIDYSPILLIVPFDGNTSFIGLILSEIAPKWFILFSILIVLGIIFYKTCKKAMIQYKEEKTEDFNKNILLQIDGISIYIHKNKYNNTINKFFDGDTNKIKNIILLFTSFILITIFTIIKNKYDSCGSMYYIIYGIQFICMLIWGMFIINYIINDYKKKQSNNFQFLTNDIKWEYKTAIKYAIISSFTGLLSTYLGIGGGMILAPFMIHIGMSSEVIVATSSITTFFSSTITCIQYLAANRIKSDYGFAILIISPIYSIIAMLITNKIMSKYKKRSFITMALSLLILISIVLLMVNGFIDIEWDSFNFYNFCNEL